MDYYTIALEEAKKAILQDEVPIGAVIVYKNQVIAKAHNLKETYQDVTAHAEIIAIKKASQFLNNWHLDECTLYVTLEPCMMCSGAIIQSRIKKVVIGTLDNRWDGLTTYLKVHMYNYYPEIEVLDDENSRKIIQDYFKNKRIKKKNNV